jgi:sugar lactone lactonase YvrE
LPDGRLLVCDAFRGLLAVDLDGTEAGPPATVADGRVQVLATEVDGRPIRLCNNAAVARDGTIWFTDSSARFDLDHWKGDIIEHSGTGRLIRRDPDGTATTVATGLQFGNGVALAPDGQAVYFAETGDYSLNKLNLTGPGAGLTQKLTPALPGFPDNISTGTDGRIWVAIASPRNSLLDRLAPLPPTLRSAVWALPDSLQPKPVNLTCALAVNPATDRIVAAYATRHAGFGVSTGVREHHGTVWLGSLTAPAIASFEVAR